MRYLGDALLIYQSIVDSFPKSPEAPEARIKIMGFYLRAGQYDVLEQQLLMSQYQYDSTYLADVNLIKGKIYIGQNRYDKAKDELEGWLSNYGSGKNARNDLKPEVLYLLGIILEKHYKSYSEAFDKYSEVFENYPNSEWAGKAAKKIIELRILAKQLDEAVAITEEVKKRLSKNREIYKNAYAYGVLSLFECYASFNQKENPPCEQFFKTLNIENFFKLGKTDFESGNYEDARDILSKVKLLKECEEAKSMMPDVLLLLGECYYKLGRYNEAIGELEEWLEYGEDVKQEQIALLPEVYYYLALSYYNILEGSCKALEYFTIIKDRYYDSGYYKTKEISSDIEQKITECEKTCNRKGK
jgi:outer membrane protein assembly factor BamD (BamD/ComL family)